MVKGKVLTTNLTEGAGHLFVVLISKKMNVSLLTMSRTFK